MKLTRYELTMNGKQMVGLVQGGFGFGILDDQELEFLNHTLPMPPYIRTSHKISCFFTEKGVEMYSNLVKTAEENLKTDKNKLELRLVVKEIELNEVHPGDIIYQDEWQVHIRELQ